MTLFEKIGWSPGIGDPSIVGWFTVLAYFVTAFYALKVFRESRFIFDEQRILQKYFWLIITCTLFFLSVNKQLDLQTFFTAFAKHMAQQQEWYAERRHYQKIFIFAILTASLIIFTGMLILFRKVYRNQLLAIIGLSFLLVFIFVRASSFHHMDKLISSTIAGIKMNWLLELTGIALLFVNARQLLKQKRSIFDPNFESMSTSNKPYKS